jgi:O-Antigen ligase.
MTNKKRINSAYSAREARCIWTNLYVYIIFTVFPLFLTDGLFNVLVTKFMFYAITTALWIIPACVYIMELHKVTMIEWNEKTSYEQWRSFSVVDYAAFAMLFVAIISTILSPYKSLAFLGKSGNDGRHVGLLLIILYIISYFMVSRTSKFRIGFINAFLIVSLIVNLLGITDYFQLDVLGIKANMHPDSKPIYTSTIGNINTYTSYVALPMAISVILFCKQKEFNKKTIFYVISLTIAFFAIIMGNSDNAYLALAVLFGFAPLYVFTSTEGIRRYLAVAGIFLIVAKITAMVTEALGDKVIGIQSLFNVFDSNIFVDILIIIILVVLGIWYFNDRDEKVINDKGYICKILRRAWVIILCTVVAGVAWIFVNINVIGNDIDLGGLNYYFIFNDNWGTNRGYIWRVLIELYNDELTFVQKLFGYGPETFASLMKNNVFVEMVTNYNVIFDSPHNIFLQYLITTGIFGLSAYLVAIIGTVVSAVKYAKEEPHIMSMMFAGLCFYAQGIVNINPPIVTPIVLLFGALIMGYVRDVKKVSSV